jgi:hypothetical protein
MAKTDPLGVRLEPKVREALEAAADKERRSLSAMAAFAVEDWLRRHCYLLETKKRGSK